MEKSKVTKLAFRKKDKQNDIGISPKDHREKKF